MIARLRRFFRELDGRLGVGYALWRLRYERSAFDATFAGVPRRDDLRVSVVVPSYGISVADLTELVASLDRQTHDNWELCVCDDADKLPEATAYWKALAAKRPERIRLVAHPHNRGISEATKSALELARGDIIAFVDGDDRLHRRALEAVTCRFGEDDAIDVVYTDHDLMTDFGQRLRPSRKPGFSPELMLSCNYINHLVAARRELVQQCASALCKENDGAQDWALCLALIRGARRISHVPMVLYHWRARRESIASGGGAKPWATAAADRVRRRHWQELHPAIRFGENEATGFARARLAELPHVLVLSSDQEWAKRLGAKTTVRPLELARLSSAISESPKESLVLFAGDIDQWSGDIAAMGAYAMIRKVACVWPFSAPPLRRAYRLAEHPSEGRTLVPLQYLRSDFSYLSGNVLCGPTIGMLLRREQWLAMIDGGFVVPERIEELGPALGLWALEHGLRNVACGGVVCDAPFSPVRLPRMPEIDPYL